MARAGRTLRIVCVVAVLGLVGLKPAQASASPGQVDPTFGHLANGTALTDHGPGEFVDKLLRQPDGKIVAVENGIDTNLQSTIIVARYLANGSLDPTFGTGGTFTEPTIGAGTVTDGALQPDGKIVVVGWTEGPAGPSTGTQHDFFVIRLRANGTIDPTFVTAHPTTNFSGTSIDEAFGVALGPAGTIVVAGRTNENVAIARYTSTGALDTTFSGDGLLTQSFNADAQARAVIVQGDGKIVVAGSAADPAIPGGSRLLLARFDVNGTLDNTYGTAGQAAFASAPIIDGEHMLLQATKVVVTGIGHATGNNLSRFHAVARYDANGTLDTTFGTGGASTAGLGKFSDISGLALDGSGRLVATGESAYTDDFPDVPAFTAVFRYSANGIADPTFGCNGYVLTEALGNGAGTVYNSARGLSLVASGNDVVVGSLAVTFNGTDFPHTDTLLTRYSGSGGASDGYALLRGDGGTSAFGGAPACGSLAGLHLNAPVVGTAFNPVVRGNWEVASDGGVFSFGAASFFGSTGSLRLNKPIVGMAPAPDGHGYWLVASDGGVFSFGSARFFGSTGGIRLNKPVVGIAGRPDARGYWLVASDGGVFAFGSAPFYGSTGGITLNQPVVGIAADPTGTGYWMGARDGGIFTFGSAHFAGSTGSTPFPVGSARSTIGIAATP